MSADPISDLTPVAWLERLASVLGAASARIGGEPAPVPAAFDAARALLEQARARDACLWWVGNGGSAGICAHLAQDAMNKLRLRSLALTDASLLTCMANDFGYEQVYARPLGHLARPGDVLVAVSSSGRSPNILAAVDRALSGGIEVIACSGFRADNPLRSRPVAVGFHLPEELYGTVEVGHLALLHALLETMSLAGS